ncbi:MAG: ROK family protein [bacterium]|nr:ROK family protein [bacterium]
MMEKRFALGLDFGGTKLAAGVIDLSEPCLVDSAFRSTRRSEGAEGAVVDMIDLASGLQHIDSIDRIGICYGGYAANNRVLKSLHVPGWDAFPLGERLQDHFGSLPVYLANDANAVGLGEYRFGAGRGARSMMFITVSTGVGGGVILDGHLWEGEHGLSGEIGHTRVVNEGALKCDCGRYGCVETVCSGPSMAGRARTLLAEKPEVPSLLRDTPNFTAREVDQCAAQGDSIAVQVVKESAGYLGVAIGNAIQLFDLDCVVIGGGVSRSGALWWETLRASVEASTLPWRPPVAIKPSALGTHEGIWGAVALLPQD